jgi:hypothetical protein
MNRLAIITATAGVLAIAAPLSAQRANDKRADIPKEQRPPAGMCRIWLDDVPASQQPAPTDCATAIRHRPSNGRVIFGEPVETMRFDRDARPLLGRGRDADSNRQARTDSGREPRMDSSRKPPRVDTGRNRGTDSVERPRLPERRPERRAEPRSPVPRARTRPIRPPRRPVRRDSSTAFPRIQRF